MSDTGTPALRRAASFCVVLLLHLAFVAALLASGTLRRSPSPTPVRLIIEPRRSPRTPPPISMTHLAPPPVFVPEPEIEVAVPVARAVPSRVVTHAPTGATPGHFAAATDSGLGMDVGTVSTGGVADRGILAAFEAAVRRQVMAGRRQPALAWDRRNTCVVAYTVHIGADGRLAGFSIEPCAIPEINDAARSAIQNAAYPLPPKLGSPDYQVHGSLVFRP